MVIAAETGETAHGLHSRRPWNLVCEVEGVHAIPVVDVAHWIVPRATMLHQGRMRLSDNAKQEAGRKQGEQEPTKTEIERALKLEVSKSDFRLEHPLWTLHTEHIGIWQLPTTYICPNSGYTFSHFRHISSLSLAPHPSK